MEEESSMKDSEAGAEDNDATVELIEDKDEEDVEKEAEDDEEEEVMEVIDLVTGDDDSQDEKKPGEKKDWVAVVAADEGELYNELQKIGKLISRQQKVNEIKRKAKKHRMRVFPITMDELCTPFMRGILEMCSSVQMRWVTKRTDEGITMNGILELTFAQQKDAEEQRGKLKEFKKDISVWDKYDASLEEETNRKFNKMAGIPVDADTNNKLTLLSPSLPTSVTEEELWNLFPNAREIWLISGGKRNHAYLKFLDEETLQKTLIKLREQGPPREDFSFCRLVRYYEVEHAIKYSRGGVILRPARHRSRSPGKHRLSSPSHKDIPKSRSTSQTKSSDKVPAKKEDSAEGKTDSKGDDKANTKKAQSKEESKPKSNDPKAEKSKDLKDSKAEKSKDLKDSKAEKAKDPKDSKVDKSHTKSTKPVSDSDHSKSETKPSSKSSGSRSGSQQRARGRDLSAGRDLSRGRDRSNGRDRAPRGVDRSRGRDDQPKRRPNRERIILPIRNRDRSPPRGLTSILGAPPMPVPSLLNPGIMPNASMGMNYNMDMNMSMDMNRPMDNMNRPMDNMNRQMDNMNRPMDNMNRPMDNMNRPMENMNRPMDNMNRPMDNMNRPMDNMNSPMDNVFSQLQRPPGLMSSGPISTPLANPVAQRQQGLQVLDNLLSSIGKLSARPNTMARGGNDNFGRSMDHRRSRSPSPLDRSRSPMESPVKRRRSTDFGRDDRYLYDEFSNTSRQDSFNRDNRDSDMYRSGDFGRGNDFGSGGRRDDIGGYDRQVTKYGQHSMTSDTSYNQSRDTYNDQRSFTSPDQHSMAVNPMQQSLSQAIDQTKKDTKALEGEYALMMNQLGGQTQQQQQQQQQQQPRAAMGGSFRPGYY